MSTLSLNHQNQWCSSHFKALCIIITFEIVVRRDILHFGDKLRPDGCLHFVIFPIQKSRQLLEYYFIRLGSLKKKGL